MGETLYQRLIRTSKDYQGPALTFKGLIIRYPKLKAEIEADAKRLWALGIRKDDVVCLCSPNIPQAVYAMYALNKIGAIAFIVHPLFPSKALNEDLKRTHAKLMLVIDQRFQAYQGVVDACPMVTLSAKSAFPAIVGPFYDWIYRKSLPKPHSVPSLEATKPSLEPIPTSADDAKPSFYLESGGTTGRSKIVVLSDKAINYSSDQVNGIIEKTDAQMEGTGMIGLLPMFHGFGLAMGIHAPLTHRAVSDLMVAYSGKEIVRLCRKRQLNYLIAIPYMAAKLLKQKGFRGKKLRSLTHAFIGADKTPIPLFHDFDQRMVEAGSSCRLLEGYGLTETVTVIAVNKLNARKIGSVGRPLPGTRFRILDDMGHPLPIGQSGTIAISTPSLMVGYLNDPKTTAKAVKTDPDGTRWLITGDRGHLDEDGYLFFEERENAVFKIAGHFAFPSEIEAAAQTDPDVAFAAVVYVSHPSHPYLVLFVEPKRSVNQSHLASRLKAELSQVLIRYEMPEEIRVMDKLPRTPLSKIDRKALTALASQKIRQ